MYSITGFLFDSAVPVEAFDEHIYVLYMLENSRKVL